MKYSMSKFVQIFSTVNNPKISRIIDLCLNGNTIKFKNHTWEFVKKEVMRQVIIDKDEDKTEFHKVFYFKSYMLQLSQKRLKQSVIFKTPVFLFV